MIKPFLIVGRNLCRCPHCPLEAVCPKLGVDARGTVTTKAAKATKAASKVTTKVAKFFECKPLWSITPAMLRTLQKVPILRKAIVPNFAWTQINKHVYMFCVPEILVPFVTWCHTWFTTTSLVYLLLPETLMAELSKHIPNPLPLEPVSHIGYTSTQGLGLEYSSTSIDVKCRANLHSVVHQFTCDLPKCDAPHTADMADIGGKATRFTRLSKGVVESLKPAPQP